MKNKEERKKLRKKRRERIIDDVYEETRRWMFVYM